MENLTRSVEGVKALRSFYKKILGKPIVSISSSKNLERWIDGELLLNSSTDFLIEREGEYEGWLSPSFSLTEIRRSPLPAAEVFLLNSSLREACVKPLKLVLYSISKTGASVVRYLVPEITEEEARKTVYCLTNQAKQRALFPSGGSHCFDCPDKC